MTEVIRIQARRFKMPRQVKVVWLALGLLLLPGLVLAGITGKITGRVLDATDGSGLPDVNVILWQNGKQTEIGAATNKFGQYMITPVPVGTYDVEFSFIGYGTVIRQGVRVTADQVVSLPDVKLQPGITTEVVVIRGDRIFNEDPTLNPMGNYSGEKIGQQAGRSTITDVIRNFQGAVETSSGLSGGIHIQGGRTGELAYVVDGINANDPVTGQSGVYVDRTAIKEVSIITGNFNAEYGNAMSGVVNIVTREGASEFNGGIEYETNAHLRLSADPLKYPNSNMWYNKAAATLGGPFWFQKRDPETNEAIGLTPPSFFISGNILENEDRLLHNDQHRKSGTLKLSWRPGGPQSPKFILSGNYANTWYHNYIHGYSKGIWLEYGGPRITTDNYQLNLKVTHTVDTAGKFTYDINVGTFNTHTKIAYQDGADFHDFRMIGRSQMDWVGWAYNQGRWVKDTVGDSIFVRLYNADSMKFRIPDSTLAYTTDDGQDVYFNLIEHYRDLITDQDGNVDTASAVWYYYNEYVAQNGYYIEGDNSFSWLNWEKELEALNNRWYEVNEWRPTVDPATNDTVGVYYHKFDFERYKAMYLEWKNWRPYVDPVTGDSVTNNPWEDSLESSGNMYLVRYNSDPLFRRFSYYFLPYWSERNTTKYIADFALNWNPNDNHWFKFGVNGNYHFLDYDNIQFVNENPYADFYHKEPIIAAAYVQDRISYEDLILHAGVRFDYFDPRSLYNPKPDSVDAEPEMAKSKFQVSPRVSVSFAVSEKSTMYASYGHFFQPVELQELYQNLEADLTTGVPLLGNPNLPPLKTVYYQAGFRRALGKNMLLEIKGYYKDQENLLATRQINTIYKGQLASYTIFVLEDFAKIKGFDIGFASEAEKFLSGQITYSFMDAKGTGSSGREFYYRYRGGQNAPKREYPLEFDVTHTVRVNGNFYLPPDTSIAFLKKIMWLTNLNLNVQFNLSSGAPYWGTDGRGNIIPLGVQRMPATKTVDVKLEKIFAIGRKLGIGVYVDVRNVFDWRNVANVYSNTGSPTDNGGRPVFEPALYRDYAQNGFYSDYENWQADVADWEHYVAQNPGNFQSPRQILFGLRMNF